MCSVRFPRTPHSRNAVEGRLKTAQPPGNVRPGKSRLALLAVGDGRSFAEGAVVWRVPEQSVAAWVRRFCGDGIPGAPRPRPPGRPPQLTPTHKAARTPLMDAGPRPAGCSRACWRSPMIQPLIDGRFGVFDTSFSIAP